MAFYSGQTTTNNVIDGSTASNLLSNLQSQLVSAGWSVAVSGSSTGIWAYVSGTTPQSLSAYLWMRISGSNVMLDAASTSSTNFNTPSFQCSSDFTLQTGAGFNYQVIANPYYVYIIRDTVPCPASQSFFMSIPYQPAWLSGVITDVSVAGSGTAGTTTIATGLFVSGTNMWSHINGLGHMTASFNLYGVTSGAAPTWFDGTFEFYDPRVMGTQTNPSGGGGIGSSTAVGYHWDALVFNQSSIPRNTTFTYDSHTWLVLTESTNPGLMVLIA